MAKLLWTQKQDIGPQPRSGHAMVFDTATGRVLLFGGKASDGTLLKDTWVWDGADWTQLEDIGPTPRSGHAMACDVSRNRTVLFGGSDADGDCGDTWEWDGESWTQVQDTGPSARSGHAMAFDGARLRVLLFGGTHSSGTRESDTWTWDGSDWSQVEDTGPAARSGHAMAYDATRALVVLFGGNGADLSASFGDTWEWDGTVWKHVEDIGPAAATEVAMVFRTNVCALFGGVSAIAPGPSRKLFRLTWEWDGAHWTARQDIGVGARAAHAMAFDPVRGKVVLFGGLTVMPDETDAAAGVKGDTWEHADVGGGAPVPGDGTAADIPVVAIDAQPNPVTTGDTLVLTVEIATPASGGGAAVVLGGDFGGLGTIVVSPGSTTGSESIPIPPDLGSSMPLPVTGTITATAGGATASVSVTIQ